MAHPFLERLGRGPILGDGAMGTLLRNYGSQHGGAGVQQVEEYNLTQPDWVREAHLGYIQAGAGLIETNTFAASRPRLAEHGLAERMREINFRGVKLAREAREISGQPVWVAGALGPLGRGAYGPDGTMDAALALAAFREQIAVLLEAGADLLMLETFTDLDELALALQAARETADLPVVAEMTFGNEGVTASGAGPAEVARTLAALRVDVAGVNCSMGPARVLDALAEMHRAEPDLRLSAMPNAGLPYRTAAGMVYPSAPHYFARHVPSFMAVGAVLLGGCCGSTPGHIRAMRGALDEAIAARGRAGAPGISIPPTELVAVPMVRASTPATPIAPGVTADAPEATGLLRKLRAGKFVVSVEVDPPRGFNPEKTLEGARIAKEHGADAVNVADSPMARVRMGALALCVLIQQQVGVETVLHYTTRDRSLMGLQADLIGAHALGVRNIIALTGDPPSLGDSPDSTAVYDVDSIGLVRIIGQFNAGNDRAGKPFGSRSAFTIAVACDPTRPDVPQEADRLAAKIEAGAHLVMTQPIFDVTVWTRFVEIYEERHGPFPLPVLAGILPLQSYRHANFLHNEVPGITLPETALARMDAAGADGRAEGVRMAQELLLQLRELPTVRGVYLMPSFGRYEMACEVMDVLSR
jgi:methionine synthase / methylenetetrahydrofolate reductase(NADPH)